MRDRLRTLLDYLNSQKLDYADVRFREDAEERIGTENDVLSSCENKKNGGIGIRVLNKGRWGYAATPLLDQDQLIKTAQKAIKISEAAAKIQQEPICLTQEKSHQFVYRSPLVKDPWSVSIKDKANVLFHVFESVKTKKFVRKVNGVLLFKKSHQILLTSEGADLENHVCYSSGMYTITAVGGGTFQTRNFQECPRAAGYEWIEQQPFVERASEIAEQAYEKIFSPQGPVGKTDLILMPSHLMLTIHESVGHPTELDRVLGWEANFAGTSFATPEKLNDFQYGSEKVNFSADNTIPEGVASVGFDDDGIPSQAWDVIREGRLVDYATTRETAHFIGQSSSHGCNRAMSYAFQPINRIPNLSLLPGSKPVSLEDLISDTEDGILIDGRGSFSIDQRRLNFQFGGDYFQKIEKGQIVGSLSDVTYQSITPQFWNSCDAICDDRFWELYGALYCGKGEPMQLVSMSHGCSPARFRGIDVGGALLND